MSKKLDFRNCVLFACTFFSSLLMFSLDAYCRSEILTDIVFINIAGMHFHRMEFVSIIFAVALLIGVMSEKLFRHNKIAACFSVSVLAVFTAFFAMVNTDLFQLLSPTMRISHVTMSLSRVLGIISAVSGLFVGYAAAFALNRKADRWAAFVSVIAAAVISVFMQSSGMYRFGYLLSAVLILACAFSGVKNEKDAIPGDFAADKLPLKNHAVQFLFTTSAFVLLLIMPRVITVNGGMDHMTASVVSAVLLFAYFAAAEFRKVSVCSVIGVLVGSIIHYVLVHFVCIETVYSGNRVIYSVQPAMVAVIAAVTVISFVLMKVLSSKKSNN